MPEDPKEKLKAAILNVLDWAFGIQKEGVSDPLSRYLYKKREIAFKSIWQSFNWYLRKIKCQKKKNF
jgi:hypothetical protein